MCGGKHMLCTCSLRLCIALNDSCQLTEPLGQKMAEFPLNPMFARMLLMSGVQWLHCITPLCCTAYTVYWMLHCWVLLSNQNLIELG